jgi:hypothetical protein
MRREFNTGEDLRLRIVNLRIELRAKQLYLETLEDEYKTYNFVVEKTSTDLNEKAMQHSLLVAAGIL